MQAFQKHAKNKLCADITSRKIPYTIMTRCITIVSIDVTFKVKTSSRKVKVFYSLFILWYYTTWPMSQFRHFNEQWVVRYLYPFYLFFVGKVDCPCKITFDTFSIDLVKIPVAQMNQTGFIFFSSINDWSLLVPSIETNFLLWVTLDNEQIKISLTFKTNI